MNDNRPALWNKDFILAFASNLLLFFSFYMLIPVLPFYLTQNMGTSNTVAGIVLSLYTISALLIRPFSGFLVDMFARKPLYLLCYGFFSLVFAGYVVAVSLTLLIVLRVLHGLAFGLSTVSGSTVAVDIMPASRRGKGIGYFGMAANIAMAVGPVAGLWLQKNYSYNAVFLAAFTASVIGWIAITRIKPIRKESPDAQPEPEKPLSLDRFILVRALPCVALLFLGGLGYGTVLNYIGLYSDTRTFYSSAGLFFVLLAVGIVLARLLSARALNRGRITAMIFRGTGALILAYCLFLFCHQAWLLYLIAFLLGVGFGYFNPAFQTLLIDLAHHNQRGTANATYFTFWDFGIGFSTAIGGVIIEKLGFHWLYALAGFVLILGWIYFARVSGPWFERKKLR
ncbi:MAG: MFS transporter [Rikenellaceae bacterium]|nr:MFS transporter [Rikenellaceae bacterium]